MRDGTDAAVNCYFHTCSQNAYANGRAESDFASFTLSLSLSRREANSISKCASERGASCAIRFLCREENRFVEAVAARSEAYLPLDDSHAIGGFSSFDRQFRVRTRALATLSSRLLSSTITRQRIYAEDAVLRDTAAGGRRSRPLRSPHLGLRLFFFPRAVQPPFLCLPSCRLWIAINRRDKRRGTRTLRFFLRLMPCDVYTRDACKKLLSTSGWNYWGKVFRVTSR